MKSNELLLSDTIKYLRFPMTVGIILIHSDLARVGITIHGVQYGMNYPDWYLYFCVLFSETLSSICVPAFFVISGYLFFYKVDYNGSVYAQKLKKRIKTLLVPYILWNMIALLFRVVRMSPLFSSIFQNVNNVEFHFSLIRLFNSFFYDDWTNGLFVYPDIGVRLESPIPMNGPMWYVRDLMIIILLTPIVYYLIKKLKVWFLIGMAIVLYYGSYHIFPNMKSLTILIDYFFFFSWGAYYSINKLNIVEQMRRIKYIPILFLILVVLCLITNSTEYNRYVHFPTILTGIVSSVALVSYLLEKGRIHVNETLANSSFFIFALHSLILNEIGKLLFICVGCNDSPLMLLFLYILIPVVTILICVGLYKLLNRFAPAVCSLLTGGR